MVDFGFNLKGFEQENSINPSEGNIAHWFFFEQMLRSEHLPNFPSKQSYVMVGTPRKIIFQNLLSSLEVASQLELVKLNKISFKAWSFYFSSSLNLLP